MNQSINQSSWTTMRAAVVIPIIGLLSMFSLSWLETFHVAIIQQQNGDNVVKQSTSHDGIETISFIDVRKSGGKDIKYMFPIICNDNEDCAQQVRKDAVLSDKITSYLHVKGFQPNSQSVEEADAFLFNVRHPIDRIISWYQMETPQACADSREKQNKACSTRMDIAMNAFGPASIFYRECFPTIGDFLMAFDTSQTKKKKTKDGTDCIELANDVVKAKVTGPGFQQAPFEYDMHYYMKKTVQTFPKKKVLVLRSESVWDDLNALETQLGGKASATFSGQDSFHPTQLDVDVGPLCCILMEEMRSYRQLLKLASNLDIASKKETIKNAVRRCGFDKWKEMEAKCQAPQQKSSSSSSSIVASSSSPRTLSFNNIMFVDIRKSKGSTMRQNFHIVCEVKPKQCSRPAPESALSNNVIGYMHGKGDSPPLDMIQAADAYLFELRHPVDRILALYHYHDASYDFGELAQYRSNYKYLFVEKCFHRKGDNGVLNQDCINVATKVVQDPFSGRSFKPLEYYSNLTIDQYPSKTVLAVRADSMWADLNDLDFQLGGKGKFGEGQDDDESSFAESDDDTADYASLCCALQDDIYTYRRLIELSVNLDKKSKKETIANALQRCGFTSFVAMADQCDKHLAQAQPSSTDNATVSLLPSSSSSSSSSSPVLPYEKIVFVHVGKAGGQTLRILFQAFCTSDRKHIPDECAEAPPSMLSDKTSGYIHPKEVRPADSPENADAFLFNLRHPVDRMISWYHYEHPTSCLPETRETRLACNAKKEIRTNQKGNTAMFFKTCFPTQDLLPLAFNDRNNGIISEECVDLAKRVIRGQLMDRGFKHIYYNMRYYTNLTSDTYPDADVLVVRIESLWEDFKSIDVQLGGNGNFGKWDGTRDSHGSEKYKQSNTTLSTPDYGLLCCALLDEMNIYRDLMERAVNLDEKAKEATIASAVQRCGFSSWKEMEDHCRTS